MVTALRTFLVSWRRSLRVLGGCLVCVALVQVAVRLPLPPWLARIILMLQFVAALVAMPIVCSLMGSAAVVFLVRKVYHETPWAERSDKAKEKVADSLLSVSNAVMGAASVAFFVVPLTAVVQAIVRRTDLWAVLSPLLKPDQPWWQPVLLVALYLLPIIVAVYFRTGALDIYDEIAKKATPEPAIGPNGAPPTTRACPRSADTPTL
jgi:hypothetical protein